MAHVAAGAEKMGSLDGGVAAGGHSTAGVHMAEILGTRQGMIVRGVVDMGMDLMALLPPHHTTMEVVVDTAKDTALGVTAMGRRRVTQVLHIMEHEGAAGDDEDL